FTQSYSLLISGATTVLAAPPVLTAAVSRKVHANGVGGLDVDVFAGHTESRSAQLAQPSGALHIVATFDRDVAGLGLTGGDVTSTAGVVDAVQFNGTTVHVQLSGVPHAVQFELAFPGVADALAPGQATA